jgi:hypothetical protein
MSIGCPDRDFSMHKKKEKYHNSTTYLQKSASELYDKPLTNNTEIEKFAQDYIEYFEQKGVPFINQMNSLESLHQEIERLEDNELDVKSLINGMGEAYIKVLLLHKKFNRERFLIKMKEFDSLFTVNADWKKYWEEYKGLLEKL